MRVWGYNADRLIPNAGNLPYTALDALGLTEPLIRRFDTRAITPRPVVFTISPGRSGSRFLAALLGATANATAFHEPFPRMNGSFLRGLSEARLAATYGRRRIKLVQVLRALRRLPPSSMYAETSHMFVKTFYDVVLDFFPEARIVHLRRRTPEVVRSFAELGYFTSASTHWRKWMHDPYTSEVLVPPVVPEHEADAFDRIIAYLADIEARAALVRRKYPTVPVVEARLEEISDPQGARRLVEELGLRWTDAAAAVCARRRNVRARKKRIIGTQVDLDYCRERLDRYVARARERSQPLPDGLLD